VTTKAHLYLCLRVGLLTGFAHGLIDVVSRLISLSFEWFELYQPFILSGVAFTLGFFGLWIAIELLQKLRRKQIGAGRLAVFYVASGFWLIVATTGIVIINFYLPGSIAGNGNRINLKGTLVFLVPTVGLYFLTLTKGAKHLIKAKQRWEQRGGQAVTGNALFLLMTFTFFSLCADLYLNNRGPSVTKTKQIQKAGNLPNVLLVTLDTVRADHLSIYGYKRDTTPFLAELSANSIVFDNATSASSWTLPSHASLLTGLYPFHHRATLIHMLLDQKVVTLAEVLGNHGYSTAGFIGGPFCKAKYGIGQGFDYYSDRLDFFEWAPAAKKFDVRMMINALRVLTGRRVPNINDLLGADGGRSAEELNTQFLGWLKRNRQVPFFAFINFFDAHEPYTPSKHYRQMFTPQWRPYRQVHEAFTTDERGAPQEPELVKYMVSLYDAELRYIDDQIRALFNGLRTLEALDSTLVIITSDHGEEFNEHGGFDHGLSLYEEVIHVPLLVYWPAKLGQKRVGKRIDNLDIFATVLDYLGIPSPVQTDSETLRPLIESGGVHQKRFAYSELWGRTDRPELEESQQQAISDDTWKLIEVYPEKRGLTRSLFNLEQDNLEQNNLYKSDSRQKALLRQEIQSLAGSIRGE
jgi:arylsulfatase A-like enzyme